MISSIFIKAVVCVGQDVRNATELRSNAFSMSADLISTSHCDPACHFWRPGDLVLGNRSEHAWRPNEADSCSDDET